MLVGDSNRRLLKFPILHHLWELVSQQFFGTDLPVAAALAITKGKSSDFHTDQNFVTLVLQLTDKQAYLMYDD
eukprot:3401446-Amphidinium_carterae.1